MKHKIGFFGCSFTWGDGYGDTENIKHLTFLPKYKFSNIIKESLNCKVKNYAIVGNSNENIFRQLYLNEKDCEICIVQISLYQRCYKWNEIKKEFFNKSFATEQYINEYNESYEKEKVVMMIKLFEKYLNNKKIYWIFYPEIPNNLNSDNIIQFGKDGNLESWAEELGNVRISKDDNHFNKNGNILISKTIIKHLGFNYE
jgi:hypothetical protein